MSAAPVVTFFRMIDAARAPQRADRSAAGTLPMRAVRYCEAVTGAAGFGWHIFPPMDFSLLWDGTEVFWSYPGHPDWLALDAAQFPDFSNRFDDAAPGRLQGCSPPFLTALPEPGVVQVWTGLLARTRPGWSLLVRLPANLPPAGAFAQYEGIVESDMWFGPVFTNLRLTRTDRPIRIHADVPLLQVQPLPRSAYAEETLAAMRIVAGPDRLAPEDWDDYEASIVRSSVETGRKPGAYAVASRRRRKGECPFTSALAGAEPR